MKKHLAFVIVGLSVIMISCSKGDTGPQGATGPGGPSFTGEIMGHVWLYDQYGTRMDTGLAGAQLTLVGRTKDTMVTSDANGAFTFSNITTGNYTISAHVPNGNFGDTKVSNFQYISDLLNRDVKMSIIPSFSVTTLTAMPSPSGNDSLSLTFAADTKVRSVIVFVNNNSTVNGLPANYLLYYVRNIPVNQTKITLLVPASDLRDVGISSGSTVYFAAYGYPVSDYSAYEDISTGKIVFQSVSANPLLANAIAP